MLKEWPIFGSFFRTNFPLLKTFIVQFHVPSGLVSLFGIAIYHIHSVKYLIRKEKEQFPTISLWAEHRLPSDDNKWSSRGPSEGSSPFLYQDGSSIYFSVHSCNRRPPDPVCILSDFLPSLQPSPSPFVQEGSSADNDWRCADLLLRRKGSVEGGASWAQRERRRFSEV